MRIDITSFFLTQQYQMRQQQLHGVQQYASKTKKKLTKETKDKMSEAHKNRDHSHKNKKVYQYTLSGKLISEFESAKKATLITGIKNISHCAAGKRKTAGGYKWRYTKTYFFEIWFNDQRLDYKNNKFLIDKLGAKLASVGDYEYLEIEIRDFEHLKEILDLVDKEFDTFSSANISFDNPTIFIDL